MKTSRWWCGVAAAILGISALLSPLRADGPPWPPMVSVFALDPDAAEEGSDPATFLVVRLGAANAPLAVQYTLGGTAENGVDYELLPGLVTIPAGAHFAPVVVTPIDDYEMEGVESVVLALQLPPTWPPPYFVTWPSVAVAEIADNDRDPTNHPPRVTIVRPPAGAVFEAGDDIAMAARAFDRDGRVRTVEFFANGVSLGIVTNRPWLVARSDLALTLDSADPVFEVEADAFSDLELDGGLVPLPVPGDWFRLVWAEVPPGHYVLTAVATDNDGAATESEPVEFKVTETPPLPVVNVRATDPVATEPRPTTDVLDTATFTIHRRGPAQEALHVFYRLGGTASNGVDYVELASSVVIPAGERTAEVVVEPLADNLVEETETVVLRLEPSPVAEVATEPYHVGRNHTARAIIRDSNLPPNLPPAVRIVRPLAGEVFLAPADIRLVAQTRDLDGQVVSVEFFEGDNSLGVVRPDPAGLSPGRPVFSWLWSNVPPGHYLLTAVATDNDGDTTRSQPVEIKVVPHVVPPVVNLEASDLVGAETLPTQAPDHAVFTVTRTGATERSLTVFYNVRGTASNGVDYQFLPGQVQIPAGAAAADIVVEPIDDLLIEGTETVVLQLQPAPILAPANSPDWWYRIGSNRVARAFIRDNDFPPTNQPPKVAMVYPREGEFFIAPTDIRLVARAHDVDGWVRTVEFFEGTNRLGVVTNLPPADPNLREAAPEGLFQLKWANVPPGVYELCAVATDNRGAASKSDPVRVEVVSPRPPRVTILATDPYASEGPWLDPLPVNAAGLIRPNTATFTVFRHGNTSAELLVLYQLDGTAENGVDYRKLSGEVKIPAGARQAHIVVEPIDDDLIEGTETVMATLVPPLCIAIRPPPPDCHGVGEPSRATAYILDNDRNLSPKVEIVYPANGDIFRAHTDIEIEVLTKDPDGWVSRMEFFANGTQIGEEEIHFILPPPPGEVQKFAMVWSDVPPGHYALTARATDDHGARAVSDPVLIHVRPLPQLPVVTIHATDPVASEPDPATDALPDLAQFEVSRTGEDLRQPLTVSYRVGGTAANGVDYVELAGEVTIPANAAAATIEVEPLDDDLFEGTESVIITLLQPPCLTGSTVPADCYLVGRPHRAIAYIRDNETPPHQSPKVAIVSPPNGAVFIAPSDVRLIAVASDADGWVTTVEFFAGDTSLGVVSNRLFILDQPPVRFEASGVEVLTDHSLLRPFSLGWSNAPPGNHLLTAVATDNVGNRTRSLPIEILVHEPQHRPIVSLVTVDAIAREGTDDTAAFRVRRIGGTNGALTVHYALHGTAANGTDYEFLPGSVVIPAGQRTARIVVVPIDDNLLERVETVILRLTLPPAGTATYAIGRPARAGAVILDNDCQLRAPEELPDGSLHLKLDVAAGLRFRLESSTNLRDWEPEVSTLAKSAAHSYVEVETGEHPHRFFRIVPEFGELDDDE